MTDFLFGNYIGLDKNQLVKVKLKNEPDFLIGRIYMTGGMQPYQPDNTPDGAASMNVIKDLAAYKKDRLQPGNFYDKRLQRDEVEHIEVVQLDELMFS